MSAPQAEAEGVSAQLVEGAFVVSVSVADAQPGPSWSGAESPQAGAGVASGVTPFVPFWVGASEVDGCAAAGAGAGACWARGIESRWPPRAPKPRPPAAPPRPGPPLPPRPPRAPLEPPRSVVERESFEACPGAFLSFLRVTAPHCSTWPGKELKRPATNAKKTAARTLCYPRRCYLYISSDFGEDRLKVWRQRKWLCVQVKRRRRVPSLDQEGKSS